MGTMAEINASNAFARIKLEMGLLEQLLSKGLLVQLEKEIYSPPLNYNNNNPLTTLGLLKAHWVGVDLPFLWPLA